MENRQNLVKMFVISFFFLVTASTSQVTHAGNTAGQWTDAHNGCPDSECSCSGVNCANQGAGNPIHQGTGNKWQRVSVFKSGGQFPIIFNWFYNSRKRPDTNNAYFRGEWTHSYSERVWESSASGVLHVFVQTSEGRVIDFKETSQGSGVFVGEEENESQAVFGKLRKEEGAYVYVTPRRIEYRFEPTGRLDSVHNSKNGLIHDVVYTADPTSQDLQKIDVVHSNGQRVTLNYGNNNAPFPNALVVGSGLSYEFNYAAPTQLSQQRMLQSIDFPAYNNAGDSVQTFTYLSDFSAPSPSWDYQTALTGVVDEEGIRYTNWEYNFKGQAIRSYQGRGDDITNDIRITPVEDNKVDSTWADTKALIIDALGCESYYNYHSWNPDEGEEGRPYQVWRDDVESLNGCVIDEPDFTGEWYNSKLENWGYDYVTYEKNTAREIIPDLLDTSREGVIKVHQFTTKEAKPVLGVTPSYVQSHQKIEWHSTLPIKTRKTYARSSSGDSPYRDEHFTYYDGGQDDHEYQNPDNLITTGLVKSMRYIDTQVSVLNPTDASSIISTAGLVPYTTFNRERVWQYAYTFHDPGINQVVASVRITNPRGHTTISSYSPSGHLILTTNALSHTVQYGDYNVFGRPGWMTDENGVTTTYTYTARGWLLSSSKLGRTTLYTYYKNGLIKKITASSGLFEEFIYDTARKLVEVRSNAADISSAAVTRKAKFVETIDRAAHTKSIHTSLLDAVDNIVTHQTTEYDSASRIQRVIDGESNETRYHYDPVKYREVVAKEIVDSTNGTSLNTRYKIAYDNQIRVEAVFYADNGSESISESDEQHRYTDTNTLVAIINGNGQATRYFYDGFERLIREDSPDRNTLTYEYDAQGNLASKARYQCDNDGDTVSPIASCTLLYQCTFSYDELDRVTQKTCPTFPENNVTYGYDDTSNSNHGIGLLTQIVDQSGETQLIYSAHGLLVEKNWLHNNVSYTTRYNYDINNSLTSVIHPSGRMVEYTNDNQGRVVNIVTREGANEAANNIVSNVEYNPAGAVTTYSYGNGLTRLHEFNQNVSLTALEISDTSPVISYEYTVDAYRNLLGISDIVDPVSSHTFLYDDNQRLKSSSGPAGVFNFTYDSVGNRQSRQWQLDGTQKLESYFYDPFSNRIDEVVSGTVMGIDNNVCTGCAGANVALAKPAVLSSDGWETNGARAVDGDTSGDWNDYSIAHTWWEKEPWWEVDLESSISISHIVLHNRTDCCMERLQNAYILLSNTPFTSTDLQTELARPEVLFRYIHGPVGTNLRVDIGAAARYVRVQLEGDNVGLGLAEVEIIGHDKTYGTNIALNGTATQSSTYTFEDQQYSASLATDGNRDGDFANNSVAHTNWGPESWWQIDLGSLRSLGSITLYNRTDCCEERLQDFYVLTSSEAFPSASLAASLDNPNIQHHHVSDTVMGSITLLLDTNARYVRVQLAHQNMGFSLAEVEIIEQAFSAQESSLYVHDALGNITDNGRYEFYYDQDSRLIRAVNKSDLSETVYQYNALGQRVSKAGMTETTLYFYGLGGELVEEVALLEDRTKTHISLNGNPVASVHEGTTYFVHSDHLGTPEFLTDSSRGIVWSIDKSPYGIATANDDPDGDGNRVLYNLRFPGQYWDEETQTSYNYFRNYDPSLGRYLQSDPIGLEGGINTYGYVFQNPVMNADPTGLICGTGACVGIGIGVARAAQVGYRGYRAYQSARALQGVMDGLNDRTSDDGISVPYPPRKRGKYTCICRVQKDGRSSDNCSNNNKDFGYGHGVADDLRTAKRQAEKMAKDTLGAKSTHHPQCRCTDPTGNPIIPHG